MLIRVFLNDRESHYTKDIIIREGTLRNLYEIIYLTQKQH